MSVAARSGWPEDAGTHGVHLVESALDTHADDDSLRRKMERHLGTEHARHRPWVGLCGDVRWARRRLTHDSAYATGTALAAVADVEGAAR